MSPIKTINCTQRPLWTPRASLSGSVRIAALNDRFREALGDVAAPFVPGRAVITSGVAALDPALQFYIIRKVRAFDSFAPDDDPHQEHDFGAIEIEGLDEKIFWKIDVYADGGCEWGAEDPGDPAASFRLLTILFADEY